MIKEFSVNSKYLNRDVVLYFRVPDKIENVLFCHDANNLFFKEKSSFGEIWDLDNVLTNLEKEGYPKTLVISYECNMLNHGMERMREYSIHENNVLVNLLAQNDPTLLDSYPEGILKPKGIEHLKFLRHELIPFVQSNYPEVTNLKKSVMGSSMGGMMSLITLIEMQDYFDTAFCVSNAFWYAEDQMYNYVRNAKIELGKRLYLDCGTMEKHGMGTTNEIYIESNKKMYDILKEKDVEVILNIFAGGIHNESAWRDRLDKILKFEKVNYEI